MNPRSLRFRLVLWHALWLGAVFLVTGALLYFAVGRYLEQNLAKSELARAHRVAALIVRLGAVPADRYAAEITADFAPEASGRFIRVFRPSGAVLYQSGPPGDDSFAVGQIGPPPPVPGVRRITQADGTELVLVTLAADRPGPTPASPPVPFWVEVGQSLAPAGGYVLVARALRPVAEITRAAEGITSRNLSERLPLPPTGNEFEQLSAALNRMIARLDEAFQLNRRFLADASHELRTPLTILRSELEALVQRRGADAEPDAAMVNLLEEVQRLAGIVENLFALSRLEAGLAQTPTVSFDLARLAATTAEQMCLLAEDKGVTITCETPAPVMLEGDRGRFKQVIVNLLDNAIKYTPPGGAITLSVRAHNGAVVCEVSDNGVGIPAAALPHVFDRFYRVDPARNREQGGAGLGLAIVKAICAAHNGRVEVTSTEGAGSCFRVVLPPPRPQ